MWRDSQLGGAHDALSSHASLHGGRV